MFLALMATCIRVEGVAVGCMYALPWLVQSCPGLLKVNWIQGVSNSFILFWIIHFGTVHSILVIVATDKCICVAIY